MATFSNLPSDLLARWESFVPAHRWTEFERSMSKKRPTTFRVNNIKADANTVFHALRQTGLGVESVPWYRDAFILKKGTLRQLQATSLYNEGQIYVQGLSSMVPPLVLDIQPEHRILDMSAAPGSKTTQIASLLRGEFTEFYANDINKVRFFKLKALVEQQGVDGIQLTMKPGQMYGKTHPEYFDRILLDAPCSAEGRMDLSNPKSYRYWSLKKVRAMARIQRGLLKAGIRALKPGGVLVYSTCTMAPEENEKVIQDILNKFEGHIVTEPLAMDFPFRESAMTSWEDGKFDPSIGKTVRVYPSSISEGFYIARLRKKTSLV